MLRYEQNNRPKELDIQTDHLIRKVTFSDEKKRILGHIFQIHVKPLNLS